MALLFRSQAEVTQLRRRTIGNFLAWFLAAQVLNGFFWHAWLNETVTITGEILIIFVSAYILLRKWVLLVDLSDGQLSILYMRAFGLRQVVTLPVEQVQKSMITRVKMLKEVPNHVSVTLQKGIFPIRISENSGGWERAEIISIISAIDKNRKV